MIRLLLSLSLTLSFVRQPSKHPAIKGPLFYEITNPGSTDTSYLFGTLHLLGKSYVDTMPALMQALGKADIVIGELQMDSALKKEVASLTTMDTSLEALLTKKQYVLIDSEMVRLTGLPLAMFDRMQPITVYAMLLNGLYKKRHPENHGTLEPMDLYFQRRAKKAGKGIAGLESVREETEALFDSLPTKKQIELVLDLVHHEKKQMQELDKLLKQYAEGKVDMLMDEDSEGMSKQELEALLYRRNNAWLQKLPTLLDTNRAFIAVGAGHLVGDRGLVVGLRKLGYNVRQIAVN